VPDPSTSGLPTLATVLNQCLSRLRTLSLDLDIYGSAANAAALRQIIRELEKAHPEPRETSITDFVVQGTFKVRRDQVASLLSRAFDDRQVRWFTVAEFVKPSVFRFRAHHAHVLRLLDYPLNEGGSLGIRSNESGSEMLRLDLESLASGLNAMAVECPRHFADFLNEKADAITGDAFLQCSLFGELTY
jgi:hypothetical protein